MSFKLNNKVLMEKIKSPPAVFSSAECRAGNHNKSVHLAKNQQSRKILMSE